MRGLPELRARLSAHLGEAAGRGEVAVVAVDADPERPVEHPLWEGTPLVDGACHRRQLVWLGDGRVRPLHPFRLVRRGERSKVRPEDLPDGELALEAGDLLVLTPATRLGVGAAPLPPSEAARDAD